MSHNRESVREEPVSGSDLLYILFGGYSGRIAMPPFEFYRASEILNANRVFVRDVRQCWYHAGLPGISRNIDETKGYLQRLIDRYAPSRTILVGNSMGGFAAILFASLLGNARAVAFAPQTFIDPWNRSVQGLWKSPRVWKSSPQVYRAYFASRFRGTYYDLSKLNDVGDWKADVYVSQSDWVDMKHAEHLRRHPRVRIHVWPSGGHELVRHLRDRGELAGILRRATQCAP